jgi:lipopolysaccharide cholinephosphotransferase
MNQSNDNKKVQQLTLYTLKTFIDFCDSHNLRYYFTGGALIGVLRHHGFIPWDDDIDIGLPRKDFDKLHELLKSEMPEGFGICNRQTDPNWHFAMSQFIDLQSEIEINLAEKPRIAHIWVDVFPLDGLPSNSILRWLRVKNILFHRYLVQISCISTQVDVHRKRPWYEKLILNICKVIPVGKIINIDKTLDSLERILRKTDFYGSKYCGNMLGRYREKEVVPTEWFGEPVYGTFEGMQVKVPANSEKILKSLYGDFMQLPPVEDRVAHNVRIIKCRDIWH